MASFYSNSHEGRQLRLDVWQDGGNCRWTLYSSGGSVDYYTVYNLYISINGTVVYNIMIAVMKNCSRVRNFTSNLYFNTNGNNALERTITGKAVFKSTLTTVPSGYTRNKNGSLLVNPNVTNNISGKTGNLDRLDALCYAMLEAWKVASKDQLVYNYYSCHSSCHSACHGSRGRR